MAYYDHFTKKPGSKRDDWRDDALTHRPARDAQAGVPDMREGRYGDRPQGSGRAYGNRPQSDRNARGGRPQENKRPYESRAQGERRNEGRPYGDKPRTAPAGYEPARTAFAPRPAVSTRTAPAPRPAMSAKPTPAPRSAIPPAPVMDEPMRENLLVGRNPIREALRAGRDIEKLLVARGELIGSAREIVAMARERRVVVQEVDRVRLDAMAPNHQGLIAVVSAYAYRTVDDMLELARSRGEAPFLVILDGVTDPHNLGAIIRSAECAGAHGVIIPERRAVGLTPAAVKASAGAVEHLPVAREVNLTRVIERLKAEGVWIYGAAMQGEDYRRVDFSGPAALVIGSEGEGISRLVSEHCDRLVGLPMKGHIGSLNASVAAGVLLYAVMDARTPR